MDSCDESDSGESLSLTSAKLEILKKILKIKIKKFGTFVVIQSYIAEKKLELHAIQLQNQKNEPCDGMMPPKVTLFN
jgi:hypothetical protein